MTATARSSRLIWPVVNPTGRTVMLSTGQRTLLLYLRGQMKRGRHRFTLLQLSRAASIDVSNVSRGLDRLASFHLVGRRSTRGRNGQTITWRVRSRLRAVTNLRGKLATSIPYGRYLSAERFRASAAAGDREAVRRLAPPRMLWGRCAAGHRCRLTRWTWTRWDPRQRGELRTFAGEWRGDCRRCGAPVQLQLQVTVSEGPGRGGWERAGDVARRLHSEP